MKGGDKAKVGRRDFLRALGTGAGIAAAGTTVTASAQADTQSNEEKTKSRYRETEHIKTYYRVNSYPAKR